VDFKMSFQALGLRQSEERPMASVERALTANCPSCTALLDAGRLPAGGRAVCANCGQHFLFQPHGDTRTISRKAVASVILAIASLGLICFTAIPAAILSGWAIVDTYRYPDRLRGRKLAIASLILSFVCAFVSFILWGFIFIYFG
jgi:uncharacterized paraquat-inducible protein A